MVKFIALYEKPQDVSAFRQRYMEQHIPLVARLPGLRRYELSWVTGGPPGSQPRYHLVAELYFDDMAALKAALKSPEGQAAARDVMAFAGDIIHMLFAEVQEAPR